MACRNAAVPEALGPVLSELDLPASPLFHAPLSRVSRFFRTIQPNQRTSSAITPNVGASDGIPPMTPVFAHKGHLVRIFWRTVMNHIHLLARQALCAAIVLSLAACGSGGGVRSGPLAATPPAPPPPPPSSGTVLCPSPVTEDCVIDAKADTLTFDEFGMTGGRQSNYKLFVSGGDGTYVNLMQGDYRFSGGTTIAGTTLVVWSTLESDVNIARDYTGLGFEGESQLWLLGTIKGDVFNEGKMSVRCWSGLHDCASITQQKIDGNYTQDKHGFLEIGLGHPLLITGTAMLDGVVVLVKGDKNYVLPTTPISELLLHADSGVTGTFTNWSADGLFLQGSLRYGSNDVWFDLTRITLQSAIASNGLGSSLTAASAGNVDRALAVADRFASNPTLDQQRFLDSAANLIWMRDSAQATHALDTLSGSTQVDAMQSALGSAAQSQALGAHLDTLMPGHPAGAWSLKDTGATTAGFDQWIGPHLLMGVQSSNRQSTAASTEASANGNDIGTSVYLRAFGDHGWYAGAQAGFMHRDMQLDRLLYFGGASTWNARTRRTLDVATASIEAGRRLVIANTTLTPFLGMDFGAVHGAAAVEQGQSGFELALADVEHRQLRTVAGLRMAHEWRFAGEGWLTLQANAGLQRTAWQDGNPQRAAFVGVPDTWFELPSHQRRTAGWASLGVRGGMARGWSWSMTRAFGEANTSGQPWSLGLQREW